MGYPKDLDEYTDREIAQEYERRKQCKASGICHYCGRPLNDGKRCKLKAHRIIYLSVFCDIEDCEACKESERNA